MEYIHPKERFSHHVRSKDTPREVLDLALRSFGLEPKKSIVQRLPGGFMNANFSVEHESKKVVLRVYSTDKDSAEREFALLRYLETKSLCVPKALDIFEIQGRPIVFLEHLDGCTLEDKLLLKEKSDLQLYEEIGHQLGEIHSIRFQEAGFIGPGLQFGKEYENFSAFIRQFVEKTLTDLEKQTDRLDLSTNKRLRKLVNKKWSTVLATEPTRQLVHTDFNPKNILVTRDSSSKLLGIIDWEFSLSGNGLIDLGNFFRFPYDYPDKAKEHFIVGYKSSNSNLPLDWENMSRLLDIGNMCSFLERKEDYQKSFRTARTVIAATLEHFGY